jgi:predicted Zn-dependent protease
LKGHDGLVDAIDILRDHVGRNEDMALGQRGRAVSATEAAATTARATRMRAQRLVIDGRVADAIDVLKRAA